MLLKVIAALSAGELSSDVVSVIVAELLAALNVTPDVAIVYVPVTPAIVNVSPSCGSVLMLAMFSVVPD